MGRPQMHGIGNQLRPYDPATTPPPITKESARARRAGSTPSAAAKRNERITAAYAPPKKVARQNSQNELSTTAIAASTPTSTPQPSPARKAAPRPCRRAIAPAGENHQANPPTNIKTTHINQKRSSRH